MLRTRRVRLVAVLLIAAIAVGANWLSDRGGPSAVLRTIVLAGAQPGIFNLDEGEGRFYFLTNDSAHPLNIIDTRTGNPVRVYGALGDATGTPTVDHQSGHYFDIGPSTGSFLMIDMRTDTVLKAIPVPWTGGPIMDTLDSSRDRDLQIFGQAPDLLAIDGRSGRVLRDVAGCTASAWLAISQATQRLFEPCTDGSILMFDSRTYRKLAKVTAPAIAACSFCGILVNEATRRLFVPGDFEYGVLDARTGAMVRALPIQSWNGGSLDILPDSHDVLAVPYSAAGSGPPAREVLVLDGRTGAILHRWPVPANPVQVMVNPLTGHVLVAGAGAVDSAGDPLNHGTLSVLDPRSGSVLRQIETGILPGALAADRHARHLFVVNFNTAMDMSPLQRTYTDGWWPATQRRLKDWAGWLPFQAPAPPAPPTNVTVMMFDLTKL